jgi:TPR repeat protein
MPVGVWPLMVTVLLLATPVGLWFYKWKVSLIAIAVEFLLVSCILLSVYLPGWRLTSKAKQGDPRAQYEVARWYENHHERIGHLILWPGTSDVVSGYYWLERAAAQEYPPAMYALGARLKHGMHVPEPPGWTGPSGNVFPQPKKGKDLIDKALSMGFRPKTNSYYFYDFEFRSDFKDSDYGRLPQDLKEQDQKN